MMLHEQVYAQAILLAGSPDGQQRQLLRVLSQVAATTLAARLREGVAPEDCRAAFIQAASLYALASLEGTREENVEEFKAGDLTVKRGAVSQNTASRCLKEQADRLMAPYLKDRFAFLGV